MLNTDFFDEIRKRDAQEIINHFGPQAGKLLLKHAELEEKFGQECVEDGVKMTPLTDEFITEEARQCALDVRATTAKLIRMFSNKEMQLKLKQYETKSDEFNEYLRTFEKLKMLYGNKLNTPLEEVNSIKENLKNTQVKQQKALETRDTKKDSFDKYVEECNKSKEQRDAQIKVLSEAVGSEKANRDNEITNAVEKGLKAEEELREEHKAQVAALEKEIAMYTKQLKEVNTANKKEEEELRKEYKKATNEYIANMGSYDLDVNNQTIDNQKCQAEYEDTAADLAQIKEEYSMRLEEKKKRDQIAAIMQKKTDEQKAQMNKLVRAAEYLQAHWRGLQARKEAEKARKGKKKKKKKK